jgi:hypothetical protein
MSQTKRIEELEAALEKALHGWESCLRFKGAYLVKMDKDDKIIDEMRKLLHDS